MLPFANRKQSKQAIIPIQPYIPERFSELVTGHIYMNTLFPKISPLILALLGKPGTGKSWQVRKVAKQLGWLAVELSASSLAGENEGMVTKVLHNAYQKAEDGLNNYPYTFLLIDDFDLTLASIQSHVETSQHTQLLTSSLMELCDRPVPIQMRFPKRIPIVFTANSLDSVHSPLIRFGRMNITHWHPTTDELNKIGNQILSGIRNEVRGDIIQKFSENGLSFYRELKTEALKEILNGKIRQAGGKCQNITNQSVEDELKYADIKFFEDIGNKIISNRLNLNFLSERD